MSWHGRWDMSTGGDEGVHLNNTISKLNEHVIINDII